MYVPSHNRMQDRAQLLAFMRQYSFATLVTCAAAGPRATHLPFVVEEGAGESLRLVAHMARVNPHWRDFSGEGGGVVLVIFQGPHAYVSPSHYQRHPSVPTWNYAAVHAMGSLRLLESRNQKLGALRGATGRRQRPALPGDDGQPAARLHRTEAGRHRRLRDRGDASGGALEASARTAFPRSARSIIEFLSSAGGAAADVAEMMRDREAGDA